MLYTRTGTDKASLVFFIPSTPPERASRAHGDSTLRDQGILSSPVLVPRMRLPDRCVLSLLSSHRGGGGHGEDPTLAPRIESILWLKISCHSFVLVTESGSCLSVWLDQFLSDFYKDYGLAHFLFLRTS